MIIGIKELYESGKAIRVELEGNLRRTSLCPWPQEGAGREIAAQSKFKADGVSFTGYLVIRPLMVLECG